jgi:SAM-dependent methyltransferase
VDPATLQSRAERLAEKTFLGGRADVFEAMGRLQLIWLLRIGLYPESRVLDLGCGCLRGGFWLIHFLRPERYFGIEPNREMLEVGKSEIVGPEIMAEKRPRFLFNDQFDPSAFEVRFDFFIARSIWTHASREQIGKMLDAFVTFGEDDAVFLTSFLPAAAGEGDERSEWVGRSHESGIAGTVRHDRGWIVQECRKRNLDLSEWVDPGEKQVWLLLAKGEGAKPSQTHLARLVAGASNDREVRPSLSGLSDAIRRLLSRVTNSRRSK